MTVVHADQLITRCEWCGGWQWRGWCNTCEQPSTAVDAGDSRGLGG